MERRLEAGMQLARSVVGFAVACVFAVGPRLGRGTRPMPIDPSVQDDALQARERAQQSVPEAKPAADRLQPVVRAA
jgi:hypothetical protein